MSNKKVELPKGSSKVIKPGYEEITVPPRVVAAGSDEKRVAIKEMPSWAQAAFPAPITQLNRIQSKIYKSAFETDENLLVCAPTGAGKTNIAMLTLM
jgi:pre-mRNA-splicing helicase BRR2